MRRCFGPMAVLYLVAACFGNAKDLPQDQPIRFSTPGLDVVLASPDDGMGFVSVTHKGLKKELIKRPRQDSEAFLWKIELTTDPASEEAFYGFTNRNKTCEKRARREGDVLVLEWLGLDLREGENLMDARVTIRPKGDHDLAEWRMDVTNRGTKTGIYRPVMPVMELGVIGGAGVDDYLLSPPAEGRSVQNPINRAGMGRDYEYWEVATDGKPKLVALGDPYGFGSQRPHGIPYPTARGQMQFVAYYEKPGNYYHATKDPAGGLYLATYDGEPNPKVFFQSPDPKRKMLIYELAHYPKDQARPGLDYEMSYPVILDGFDGDWYDAATLYRRWATKQKWAARGPLHQRDEVPDWVKHATCCLRIDVKQRPNEESIERVETVRRYLPGPLVAQWYNWSTPEKKIEKRTYAFPARAEAADGFADILQRYEDQDVYVMPYVNIRIWSRVVEGYKDALRYAARNRRGEPNVWGVVKGDQVSGAAYMCDNTKFWQDYVYNVCKEMKAKFDVKALYLDQLTGAHFGGALMRGDDIKMEHGGCWNPEHGHPLGVTAAQIATQHANIERIANLKSSDGKMMVICGEGTDETLIDINPVKLIHYEIWPGYVPIFARVYHDYITAYGRTAVLSTKKSPDDPMSEMTIGWQLVCGNQLGRVWVFPEASLERRPQMREKLKYLVAAADVRAKFPEFLCLGELIRPPFMSEVPIVATEEFRKFGGHTTLPAVLAGTFRAPDGRVAVVVTNISDKAQAFDLGLDFEDAGFTGNAVRLVRVYPDEKAIGSLKDDGSVRLRLEPREIALIEAR